MSKTIGILVEYDYEVLEVWYPNFRMKEEGYKVVTIGTNADVKYTSKKGYPIKSDVSVADVTAESLDALIIPGGWAPDYLRRDKRMVDLVRTMCTSGKVTATICHGAWLLCSAKCIQGRRMTCFHAVKDDVENAGALYEDAAVVVDGNLITSRLPTDLPDFCKAIIAKLNS